MKMFVSLVSFLGLVACAVGNHPSNLKASESEKELYLSCRSATFVVDFYGPAGTGPEKIDFAALQKRIGGDATHQVTTMPCSKNPNSPTPGEEYTAIGCQDTQLRGDMLYAVSIKSDLTGTQYANLQNITSIGAQEVSKMKCD